MTDQSCETSWFWFNDKFEVLECRILNANSSNDLLHTYFGNNDWIKQYLRKMVILWRVLFAHLGKVRKFFFSQTKICSKLRSLIFYRMHKNVSCFELRWTTSNPVWKSEMTYIFKCCEDGVGWDDRRNRIGTCQTIPIIIIAKTEILSFMFSKLNTIIHNQNCPVWGGNKFLSVSTFNN